MNYQKLFDYMSKAHNVTLLESEMQNIVKICIDLHTPKCNNCKKEMKSHGIAFECVSGSTLPDGFKVYKCTDCHTINVLKDNGEITIGFCSNCEHPLWND